jgi:hypothetical protein
MKRFVVASVGLLAACGTDHGSLVHGDLVGVLEAMNSSGSVAFSVTNLGPTSVGGDSCAGADLVIGTCCWFAPALPGGGAGAPPSQPQPPEPSAGTITLTGPNAARGTYPYQDDGYPALPADFTAAQLPAGSVMSVAATGGDADAAGGYLDGFTVSAPVLAPPVLTLSALAVGQDVTVTWQPDGNATTMVVGLYDQGSGGNASCVVPDAQAAVTFDAQLLATFQAQDRVEVAADRNTAPSTTTPSGLVVFESDGYAMSFTTIQ